MELWKLFLKINLISGARLFIISHNGVTPFFLSVYILRHLKILSHSLKFHNITWSYLLQLYFNLIDIPSRIKFLANLFKCFILCCNLSIHHISALSPKSCKILVYRLLILAPPKTVPISKYFFHVLFNLLHLLLYILLPFIFSYCYFFGNSLLLIACYYSIYQGFQFCWIVSHELITKLLI